MNSLTDIKVAKGLGWECDCRDFAGSILDGANVYVDNFNEWTDYSNMEEYSKEADLKCKKCRKHRLPCYERGAKGLGHPYYDMPFKTCEGDSECCLKRFDIRTDKYVVEEEEDLMYCMVCAKDLLDEGKTIKYENRTNQEEEEEEEGMCGNCNIPLNHLRDGTTTEGHRCNNCYWEDNGEFHLLILPDYRLD